ncbi:ankyrin [Mollisia scopiformis]|uniref:Ankyrin n=1 Tax=Mollisia scopiformis TaxID=149040 RepID=A0A194XFI5_MOLSC|nr:ankyrin [Mollisia scopiformis]KUJ18532.1 ankyrin [Mollisia scopiformis]
MLKHIEDTQVLLEIVVIGGQVDHGRENEEGDMLLSKAAAGGHRRAVRALLYGSHDDINTRDKMGRTPLFWAAEGGHLDVVRELVKEGAEVSFEDQDNFTAKDLAYRRGHSEIVSLLEPLMQRDDEKGKKLSVFAMSITPSSWKSDAAYHSASCTSPPTTPLYPKRRQTGSNILKECHKDGGRRRLKSFQTSCWRIRVGRVSGIVLAASVVTWLMKGEEIMDP